MAPSLMCKFFRVHGRKRLVKSLLALLQRIGVDVRTLKPFDVDVFRTYRWFTPSFSKGVTMSLKM